MIEKFVVFILVIGIICLTFGVLGFIEEKFDIEGTMLYKLFLKVFDL